MLRNTLELATRCLLRSSFQPCVTSTLLPVRTIAAIRQFSTLRSFAVFPKNLQLTLPTLLQSKESTVPVQIQQNRTITKHSIQSGKRKTAKPVLKSFYRLNWGIWIRTIIGRHKRMYRKCYRRRRHVKNHVFLNATRSTLMDKMVCHFWKKPKYWVDDPYEPYHMREEFPMTRKRPVPAHPPLKVE